MVETAPAIRTTSDLRRSEVLEAAAYLFATNGFHATGMRELATRLQIKAGSLYHHTASKDQLLNRVCEIGMEQLFLSLDRAIDPRQGFAATIRAIMLGHAQLLRNYGSFLRCYQNEYTNLSGEVSERMRGELSGFHRRLEKVFEQAIASGEARPGLDTRGARQAIIALLFQLSRLESSGSQADLDEIATGMSDILVNGLAAR